ncbi:MAG: RlmE family RNA methyltransferase [bacterium]|nr:RlmE family RNA methyltransferase [bacterium]
MAYNKKDYYFNKAKKEGFRARSSYKLIEIAKKYQLLRKNDSVLDIGCAPGSWLQVVKQMTKGRIVGVDLVSIKPIEGVTFIQGDIEDTEIKKQLKGKFDLIISDIAPKTTGMKERDQAVSYILSRESFLIAKKHLNTNGNFLVKTFQSQETEDLVKEMKSFFTFVKRYSPQSTRQGSKEIYIVATGFKL